MASVVFASYFDKCTEIFPYENLLGFNIMHDEKNHSLKHGGGDIAKYGDPINFGSMSLGETQTRGLKQH
jgi:hypothetical protein